MGWTSIYNEQNKTDYTVRAALITVR
jgi:hypothetical protein